MNKNWNIKCKNCGVERILSSYDSYYEAIRLNKLYCRSCANLLRWKNTKKRSKYDKYVHNGKMFGNLKVLSDRVEKNHNVKCKCKCGNILSKKIERLLEGENLGCRKCLIHGAHSLWQGVGRIPKLVLTKIKLRADRYDYEFNLDLEYLSNLFEKQKGKCALSGLDLEFGTTKLIKTTASLDRIDSKVGYIKGNVQWVHKNVNWMKQDFSDDEFLTMCKKIVNYKRL
jgi:hypothetical protein